MPPGIDESSFTLGKLTGQIEELLKEVKDIKDDIEDIKKSLTHAKVKQAGMSATVALIFTMVYTFFTEHFKRP